MKTRILLAGISLLLSSSLVTLAEEPSTLIEIGGLSIAVFLLLGLSALAGKNPISKK